MDGAFNLGALANVLQGVSGKIVDYALVLAAVGTITMALVELVKAVIRARLLFHRFMIEGWIGGNEAVRGELLRLAAGGAGNAAAFLDQPSEKVMGQVQAAANVALDFPKVYPAFYGFLTTDSAVVDNRSDHDRWREFAARIVQGVPARDTPERAVFDAASREGTQARARLGNLVTRRLDTLQTRIDYAWARINQVVAVVGGAILLFLALPAGDSRPIPLITRLVLSIVGGLVAPFAKDVVSALSGLRTRR